MIQRGKMMQEDWNYDIASLGIPGLFRARPWAENCSSPYSIKKLDASTARLKRAIKLCLGQGNEDFRWECMLQAAGCSDNEPCLKEYRRTI
jgi:hypothetical protein